MTSEQFTTMCRDLLVIPYYPRDQHDIVLRQLERFVDRPERLRWLVDAAVSNMRTWTGLQELRGIYCSRFKPADGIEADCIETPGFRPDDNERAFLEAQGAEIERRRLEWQREAGALADSDSALKAVAKLRAVRDLGLVKKDDETA